jgi:hypothetical protein
MPFLGFEGPAGTGKTHELIESVRRRLAAPGIQPHQRILALTFMHGSRRRLDERFASHPETRSRSSCMTIDSFASHLIRRWQSAGAALPDMSQFDDVCDCCGALLERPEIARWVTATFPVVAVDEAQELKLCRLRVVRALADHGQLYVAADEFQCLDEEIDTTPFMEWFASGDVRRLAVVRRTTRPGLLNAGVALRAQRAPVSGRGLVVRYDFPNQMPFAVGHALNGARGSTAMLVAPGSGPWADELIPRLAQGFSSGRQTVRPVRIAWESRPSDEAARISALVCAGRTISSAAAISRLSSLAEAPAWLPSVVNSVDYSMRIGGRAMWTEDELRELCERKASANRAFGYSQARGVLVMSIHAAKNRQFKNVIVLWGPGVRGSDDHQRRLLYNAITRAEESCTVFVRTRALLGRPPFA